MRKIGLFLVLVLWSSFSLSARIIKGRLLGVDPDGKLKMITTAGKTEIYTFSPFKIKIREFVPSKEEKNKPQKGKKKVKAKGYFKKSDVFALKIGDELKVNVHGRKIVELKFKETKESLQDFYFRSKEVKMYKGKYKNVDMTQGILLLTNGQKFMLTSYTHFIPYFGSYAMGDTIVIGYVEGLNGERIAKWVKLRARK